MLPFLSWSDQFLLAEGVTKMGVLFVAHKFAEEAKVLNSIFGMSAIKIEHVGSTAVPGLSGKPIIDVLILVEDVAIADALNQKMESAGFKALGEYVMPGVR